MSDISKCSGVGCKEKEKCFRFTAPSDPYRQSYFAAPPLKPGKPCEYFWPNEPPKTPKT